MKVKELKRTVNVSWSPADQYPIQLAAGSAAQQVDATFSSSSTLEIYSLNLGDPGLDLELKASLPTQHKFQKLVWSGAGTIVGGCDGGLLEFYNAEKILKNSSEALVGSCTKHNGNVTALDINPYQKNLLASGAAESEIFIWDLNNTSQPMAPGNHSQPAEHVQGLAWNQQVQHILGSTFATRCVVWDLRKNEPIMKLSDSQSRTRWRALCWHPSVATQLCVASEDDQVPVIQLWDLRLAASPLATFEGHRAGVLSLSWCGQDSNLLLSAGKDGRVLCWNPNNTQPGTSLLTEVHHEPDGWTYEVAWCPRSPALLAASAPQQVALHSLLGGSRPDSTTATANNIMDSFGGVDSFSQLPSVRPAPPATAAPPALPRAPAWLAPASRARFAFGGKLVTFNKCPQEGSTQKLVYISQVVSEPEIIEQASELDVVLNASLSQDPAAKDVLAEYCRQRGDSATDQTERYTWFFLRAHFLPNYRAEMLNLLGFKQDEIPSKFKGTQTGDFNHVDNNVDFITSGMAALSRGESTETEADLSTDTSTNLSDAHTLIERKLSAVEDLPSANNVAIPNGEDSTSLICRALVCGNLEEAVELCLDAKRIADALVIASLSSPTLLNKVQNYHLSKTTGDPVSTLTGALLASQWDLLLGASPSSWRSILAHVLTHAEANDLARFCKQLGDKLSKESDPSLASAASICYLCGAQGESVAARWRLPALRAAARAVLLRRAVAERAGDTKAGGKLDAVMIEYAARLASQGCLQSALNSLEGTAHSDLKDRLLTALGQGIRRTSAAPQQNVRARTVSANKRHPHAELNNAYNSAPSSFDQQNPWAQASVPSQPYNTPSYNQSLPGYNQSQPGYNQSQPGFNQSQPGFNQSQPGLSQAPAFPPPVTQPPRPGSVGPHSGGITSRSKYKVDPSVQAAPNYGQYSFNNPVVSQPTQNYSDQYSNQFNQNSVPLNQNPVPLNPNSVPLNQNPAQLNQGMNGGYYQSPVPVAQEALAKPAPPGWNDPPMMTSKPKPKQEIQAQAPITHPLFGVEPPQHIPLQPTQQFPGQQQQFPGQQQQFPGQQQQFTGQQQYQGQQFGQQGYGQGYPPAATGYPQQAPSPAPVEPAPVQKEPIPEEHLVIQTVFDAIKNECLTRAANQHMKKKLEDVQRKLETLYDLLREYRLSESALGALHTCVQYAQGGDYDNAVVVATSLATGADFATVASFLPGLKTLLQLATQLHVYIR